MYQQQHFPHLQDVTETWRRHLSAKHRHCRPCSFAAQLVTHNFFVVQGSTGRTATCQSCEATKKKRKANKQKKRGGIWEDYFFVVGGGAIVMVLGCYTVVGVLILETNQPKSSSNHSHRCWGLIKKKYQQKTSGHSQKQNHLFTFENM